MALGTEAKGAGEQAADHMTPLYRAIARRGADHLRRQRHRHARCKGLVPVANADRVQGNRRRDGRTVTLLLALVLGFLVFTAFSVFSGQQSEAQSLGPLLIEFDVALENYGAGGEGGRAGLRAALGSDRASVSSGMFTRGAGPLDARGDARDLKGLGGLLFRQPAPPDGQAAPQATLVLGARPRQAVQRHADADGPPARQSVPSLRDIRRCLLGLHPVFRQWTGGDRPIP